MKRELYIPLERYTLTRSTSIIDYPSPTFIPRLLKSHGNKVSPSLKIQQKFFFNITILCSILSQHFYFFTFLSLSPIILSNKILPPRVSREINSTDVIHFHWVLMNCLLWRAFNYLWLMAILYDTDVETNSHPRISELQFNVQRS